MLILQVPRKQNLDFVHFLASTTTPKILPYHLWGWSGRGTSAGKHHTQANINIGFVVVVIENEGTAGSEAPNNPTITL